MVDGAKKHLEYLIRCLAYADEAQGSDRKWWLDAAARFWCGAVMIERSRALLVESKQLLAQIDEATAGRNVYGTVAPAPSSIERGIKAVRDDAVRDEAVR